MVVRTACRADPNMLEPNRVQGHIIPVTTKTWQEFRTKVNVVKHLPGQRLDPTNSDSSGYNTVPTLPRDHFEFLHMLCPISRKDADFWQLVSNSIVQISSVISMVISMYQATKLTKEAWAWAWVLAAFSTCSACVRMPLYLYLSTKWSRVVSIAGTVPQSYITLLLVYLLQCGLGERPLPYL
jgi:hypothetical protein